MDELEYTIDQNKRMLVTELDKVVDYVERLKLLLEGGHVAGIADWTDGYVSRDVAKVTSLLAKHQALHEAMRIVNKS